jgi:Uma2 family endonuclease
MAANIEPLLTVADLDACPDDNNRYELIEGELFVSRAPGIPHQRVLLNLEIALTKYLAHHPIGILVPGAGAVFSDHDAVIPDLVFVRNERWNEVVANDRFVAAPDLVIEIVSQGKENRERDVSVKRQLYGKYRVAEYWIVDRENQSVVMFHLQGRTLEEVAILKADNEIESIVLPGLKLKVSTIFNMNQ